MEQPLLSDRVQTHIQRWKSRPHGLTYLQMSKRNAAVRYIQYAWRQFLKKNQN